MFRIGYKAFNTDMTNRYGDKFEIGKCTISREEIINMMLNVHIERRNRFIRDYNLTEEELKLFEGVGVYGRDCNQGCKRKQLKKY